jgi:hypothetical protein
VDFWKEGRNLKLENYAKTSVYYGVTSTYGVGYLIVDTPYVPFEIARYLYITT